MPEAEKMLSSDSRIYVAGHRGLVGSAILCRLKAEGFANLVVRTSEELDLRNQQATEDFFVTERPEYVFLGAARVGGIHANNTYPADFIRDNLQIQTNVIDSSYRNDVKRLLFLGSSCIYPRDCPQPIKEEYLLAGPLEPTNRPYALAKIAGIEMCWSYNRQYGTRYIAAMPTNLYGPNDNFDLNNSHVLPAMIRKFHLARLALAGDVAEIIRDEERHGRIPDETLSSLGLVRHASGISRLTPHVSPTVSLWGTGAPRREFLHSDDMAGACLYLMEQSDEKLKNLFSETQPPLVNIGCGEDLTICELAELIKEVVGFQGKLIFDASKPDGTPRKLMDMSKLNRMGWRVVTPLREGITATYESYLKGRA